MNKRRIPSDEEFARARAAVRERDRGLSEVRSRILCRFHDEGLHEAFVFYSPASGAFVAHLFFRWADQLVKFVDSGHVDGLQEAVAEELERVGRGDRASLNITLDLDSHENVEMNFDGDYFLRLR